MLFVVTQSSGTGIPQGAATSTLYANIYLHVLDRAMMETGCNITRYADDFITVSDNPERVRAAFSTAGQVLQNPLHLQLNREKTRICHLREGFVFLGYHFDESGRRPSKRAVGTLTAKIQEKLAESNQRGETSVDTISRLRSSLQGWCNYFGMDVNQLLGAQAGMNNSPGMKNVSGIPMGIQPYQNPNSISRNPSEFSEEHIARFLSLFHGRTGVYARQWVNREGKYGYVPIRQALSPAIVRSHFAGEVTVALYIMREDNTVSFMTIDIDSKAGKSENIEDTHEMALRIKEVGSKYGLSIYLEESGSKGRHCWVFFACPISASEARQLGKLLVTKAGPVSRGVVCEVFPKQDRVSANALGSLIKLPLGIHQVTKRRCLFLEDDGSPIPDQGRALHSIRPVSSELVKAALAGLSGKTPPSAGKSGPVSQSIQQVLDGCSVLKYLVDRVREVKHLTHSERLVLLYTFGHMGAEGAAFIHRVVGYCDNYNPDITQKWLNRLEQGRLPISCARIKDWLYDIVPVVGCACSGNLFHGKYPSPMFYAQENTQGDMLPASDVGTPADKIDALKSDRAHKQEELLSVDDIWREMEEELFSVEDELGAASTDAKQGGE